MDSKSVTDPSHEVRDILPGILLPKYPDELVKPNSEKGDRAKIRISSSMGKSSLFSITKLVANGDDRKRAHSSESEDSKGRTSFNFFCNDTWQLWFSPVPFVTLSQVVKKTLHTDIWGEIDITSN